MIFLCVGTQYPFDRLVRVLDDWASGNDSQDVFGQIGRAQYVPRSFPSVDWLDPQAMEDYVSAADVVVSHAGVGIILLCVEQGTPILAVPRLARLGEHVNDHQVGTARELQRAGIIESADRSADITQKLDRLLASNAPRTVRTQTSEITAYIKNYLCALDQSRTR